jgi:hypothetical protein
MDKNTDFLRQVYTYYISYYERDVISPKTQPKLTSIISSIHRLYPTTYRLNITVSFISNDLWLEKKINE